MSKKLKPGDFQYEYNELHKEYRRELMKELGCKELPPLTYTKNPFLKIKEKSFMSSEKPREWIIYNDILEGQYYKGPTVSVGETVKAIEHSAYQALQVKLDIATKALNEIAATRHGIDCDYHADMKARETLELINI